MKYFGRAPSICSLITASTISHFQRNQLFVIKFLGTEMIQIVFTKSKGGEMAEGDKRHDGWRSCVVFADDTLKKSFLCLTL